MSRERRLRGPLLLAAALVAAQAIAGNSEPLPYRVAVDVRWGSTEGPESLRSEMESEVAVELTRARCFAEVHPLSLAEAESAPPADLELRLTIDGYFEEIEYEYAISQRAEPGAGTQGRAVAHVGANLHALVVLLPDQRTLHRDKFRTNGSWRPIWNEDPRQQAQQRWIEGAVKSVRRFVCKHSASKWTKRIERARSDPERPAER